MKPVKVKLIGQPFKQATCVFDDNSIEPKPKQLVHRKLAAAVFQRNNDAIDPRLRSREPFECGVEGLLPFSLIGPIASITR